MLDRSIPFYNTIMRCDEYMRRDAAPPPGFSFSPYRAGYEREWARLEYCAGDFGSPEEAEDYFRQTYMRDMGFLSESGVFLLDREGTVIGSCIAWRDRRDDCERDVSSLHWLILDEPWQGRGLGRLLCARTMDIFAARGDFPVYVHTQPWSWKAIMLYLSLGFRIRKTDTFSHYANEYADAMRTLKTVLPEADYAALLASAEE